MSRPGPWLTSTPLSPPSASCGPRPCGPRHSNGSLVASIPDLDRRAVSDGHRQEPGKSKASQRSRRVADDRWVTTTEEGARPGALSFYHWCRTLPASNYDISGASTLSTFATVAPSLSSVERVDWREAVES